MQLIDAIPIGKKNRENRKTLMKKANISTENDFKKELKKTRKEYIVIFDDGYYLPETKEEYDEFTNKIKEYMDEMNNTLKLAEKEMEGKEYVRSIYNNTEKC